MCFLLKHTRITKNQQHEWTKVQICNRVEMYFFISICPVLSSSPEKALAPDLAGMARMKQHERWAGMLLRKAGVQQRWHWEWGEAAPLRPLCWRGRLGRELSSISLILCLAFPATVLQKGLSGFVYELYRSFINCVGSLLPLLLHFGEIKVGRMSWDHSLA